MYHARFYGTHYEMGRRWGELLHRNGREILDQVPFPITEERVSFSQQCEAFYECWFPEVLAEIQGVAAGQQCDYERLLAVLLSMYCIMPEQRSTVPVLLLKVRAILFWRATVIS